MEKHTERLIHLIKKAQKEYSEENHVIAIPGFMAKKFIAYCSMREDLQLLLDYLEILKTESHNQVIQSSLTYALLSIYGKCFTDASKNKYPKLEPNQIFEDQAELRETHDFLMDLRHQFIAHRGKTDSEIGISFMVVPKEDGEPQIRFKQLKQASFNEEEINKIEEIIKYLKSTVQAKIQKSGQKVYDGFFELFDTEEISKMIMNNVK